MCWKTLRILRLAPVLALPLALGCDMPLAQTAQESPNQGHTRASVFLPEAAGSISGRVLWQGPLPQVAPFEVVPNPLSGVVFKKKQLRPNPNVPAIDPASRGVGNAVVFLCGVETGRARPWDIPPVRVEQRDCQFHVIQETDSQFGFVRAGDKIEMVSRDSFFHSLHAGGAAFFSLAFPDPDQPLKRTLPENGVVELTSAAGYYWMRAYLFVSDHPYYARTDAQGNFQLTQVPPGSYEIVCWLPNWKKARHERDPESGMIERVYFEKALERTQPITLRPREKRQTLFLLQD